MPNSQKPPKAEERKMDWELTSVSHSSHDDSHGSHVDSHDSQARWLAVCQDPLVSKYLSQTNHLGLDNLAPNSTCLTKISQKPKEKPFFFFHSLDGKHMTSVFADGDFVFLEKRFQFKTI